MEKRSTLLITSPSHSLENRFDQKSTQHTTYRVEVLHRYLFALLYLLFSTKNASTSPKAHSTQLSILCTDLAAISQSCLSRHSRLPRHRHRQRLWDWFHSRAEVVRLKVGVTLCLCESSPHLPTAYTIYHWIPYIRVSDISTVPDIWISRKVTTRYAHQRWHISSSVSTGRGFERITIQSLVTWDRIHFSGIVKPSTAIYLYQQCTSIIRVYLVGLRRGLWLQKERTQFDFDYSTRKGIVIR